MCLTALENKLSAENSTHGGVSLLGELQASSDEARTQAAHLAAESKQDEETEALAAAQAEQASENYHAAEHKSNLSSSILQDLLRTEMHDSTSENSTLLELQRLNGTVSKEDEELREGASKIQEAQHRAEEAVALRNKEQREVNTLGETALQLRSSEKTNRQQLGESKHELESLLQAIEALKNAINVAQEREVAEKQQEVDSLKGEDDAKAKSRNMVCTFRSVLRVCVSLSGHHRVDAKVTLIEN